MAFSLRIQSNLSLYGLFTQNTVKSEFVWLFQLVYNLFRTESLNTHHKNHTEQKSFEGFTNITVVLVYTDTPFRVGVGFAY